MIEKMEKDGVVLHEKVVSNIPGADTVIEANDILVVIGETQDLDKVMKSL
jgi:K+/H+ antiporter YhaU regulatory subunit KhtT